jgi:3-phosphoshikimate 1-carboxyvinyltransferase
MRVSLKNPNRLEGVVNPPGDKSISHRAVLFNSIAYGRSRIANFSSGDDCTSTLRCLRALGVSLRRVSKEDDSRPVLVVSGLKERSLKEPQKILDAGNSGTTMRFLTGLLAAQPFFSVITGDHSLRSRPMHRELEPLGLMGAHIRGRQGNSRAPLAIEGMPLRGIEYTMPEPSAQLKSTLLLAGLFSEGETRLHQPAASRDHSERLLREMGAQLMVDGLSLHLMPGRLNAIDITIPADLSSAAFWVIAGVCHPSASLIIQGVGVNPTRAGILEVLKIMGANIKLENQRNEGGEPVADILAESSELVGVEISGDMIPLLIDEIPVIALAACFARGDTIIRNAESLRVKETDRIQTTVKELTALGADIEELPDGMVIHGKGKLHGSYTRSHGDHRLAMTLGIAGLLAEGSTDVWDAQVSSISYPSFWEDMRRVAPAMVTH